MKTRSLALLFIPLSLFSATLRVNNAPDTAPDHTTIQAAINAATNGDTILIEGSTTPYAGFTITNKRLSLIGPGYGLNANLGTPANKLGAVISSPGSYVRTSSTSVGTANGTLIMGLEFANDLVLDTCANVTVSRCLFNTFANGRIRMEGPSNRISQCFFGGSGQPVAFGSNSSDTRIENCLIPQAALIPSGHGGSLLYLRNNLLYGIGDSSSTTIAADNNIFINSLSTQPTSTYRNNIFTSSIPPSINGSGNLGSINPSTVMPAYHSSSSSFDGRYKLALTPPPTGGPINNPALNAGTDGTHIGPFGGTNPYILSGIPPLPTIDELSVPQFAAPGSTLTIRVKVGERL